MKHTNFELLKERWPELYKHTSFAEEYVFSDPQSSTIKLRCFTEILVGILYREINLPTEPGDGFFEKLTSEKFKSVVESSICQKLHAIRCLGNKAAHGGEIDTEQSIQLLKEAYLLGRWLYTTYSENFDEAYPDFAVPQQQKEAGEKFSFANEQLALQLEQAKKELEETQSAEREAQEQISALNASLDEARLAFFRNSSSRASGSMDLQPEKTHRLLNIDDSFAGYKLTDGQDVLVKRLDDFLMSNSESVFLLRGYAGTGKTFIIKGLTEYLQSIGRNYVLAAPTGKAAKVIAEKTKSPALTLHSSIYSFNNIAEYRDDGLDGTETYKFCAELAVNQLSADTVFIVDEASMVSDVYNEAEFFRFGSGYLLRDFLKYVNLDLNDHRKKVIFIGDVAQLPPVGMSFSPALDKDYLLREHNVHSICYELTEVLRQKVESGVVINSITLRKALQQGVFNQLSINFNFSDIAKVEHGKLMDRYLESCNGNINSESIIIAHSNADVADYNRGIREHFFPGSPQASVGDKVMVVANSRVSGLFISNGDFGIIDDILGKSESRIIKIKRKDHVTGEVETINIPLTFRDVVIGLKNLDGHFFSFKSKILENLLYSDQSSLSSDENKALYVDFCIRNSSLRRGSLEFKNTLMSDPYFNALRLKFGYAITCHKAQGSEWKNVFVKCKTNQNQLTAEYFRWFYTAITRTSRNLWLMDPPNIKIGSGIKIVQGSGIKVQQTSGFGTHLEKQQHIKELINDQVPSGSSYMDQQKIEVGQSEILQGDGQDVFGIPKSEKFLLGVLSRVGELIGDVDITIDGIAHHQYQEAYTFQRGQEFARVDIGYNSKNKITRVTPQIITALSSEIQNQLSPLVGISIVTGVETSADQLHFDDDFLNEFHQRLLPLLSEQGIKILDVEKKQWNLRYKFVRENEVAVYDIYFNGKQRFTKCQPLITACSPGQLIGDVEKLLTMGLSA
jgi:hypothetical protein